MTSVPNALQSTTDSPIAKLVCVPPKDRKTTSATLTPVIATAKLKISAEIIAKSAPHVTLDIRIVTNAFVMPRDPWMTLAIMSLANVLADPTLQA